MFSKIKIWTILVIGLIFFLPQVFLKIYPDYLWFSALNFQDIFTTKIFAIITTASCIASIIFVFLSINILIASFILRSMGRSTDILSEIMGKYNLAWGNIESNINKYTRIILFLITALISVLAGTVLGLGLWNKVLLYLNQASATVTDPIFNKSLSFYFFDLPLFQSVLAISLLIVLASGLMLGYLYFQAGMLRLTMSIFRNKKIKAHLLTLGAIFFALLSAQLWLARYNIVFTATRKLFFGAGYTDIHAGLISLGVLSGLAFLISIVLIINIFYTSFKPVIYLIIGMFATSILLGGVYPNIIQSFVVKPNEYEKEKQFIEYNIKYTRQAYNLDKVEEKYFPAEEGMSKTDVNKNKEIIDNIRLWDEAPLLKTFAQLQEIRTYYEFGSADVDRYTIDGKSQQVIISTRELISSQLPDKAQNWVNKKLQYTHGYGIVMSPVNIFTEEGMPDFYIKNIPPVSEIPLTINRPEIYYGEKTDDYVIVKATNQEFDYPKGDDNAYTQYSGKGGVSIGSFFERILFSLKFSDSNIFFTDTINSNSKILFNRNIMTRVQKIAPFISYDNDPYIVVSDGRLFWMIDGYMISGRYPYSQSAGGFNYIRNSVKVVVDAYEGSVDFYLVDDTDILVNTYKRIYPGLFKPFADMPQDLKAHIRYPKDLFAIQAYMYRNYHMTNPQVFYNQEDLWEIPKERIDDSEATMEPYYITMKLPEESRADFLLMSPYTPSNKNNLISWLVTKNDPQNYGQLSVYKLPKEKQIFGPMQVESRIDQDTLISQQLTLWGQKGSRVIRGNLLIIPIEKSLLYVEPLYLQATASNLPQLKRVIVAYGDKVIMEETLDMAIAKVFDMSMDQVRKDKKTNETTAPIENVKDTARRALQQYQQAKSSLKEGNWSEYGQQLNNLQKLLEQMAK